MKRMFTFTAAALVACVAMQAQEMKFVNSTYSHESAHCQVYVSVDYPTGDDAASRAIRNHELEQVDGAMALDWENDRQIARWPGGDFAQMPGYYGSRKLEQGEADAAQWLEPGSELKYFYESTVAPLEQGANWLVICSSHSTYEGGAHPNGYSVFQTFDKRSGQLVEQLIDPANAPRMQPLIVSGLLRCFAEGGVTDVTAGNLRQYLLLDEGEKVIPLPAQMYPSADGLELVYMPYEITPYAMGRPSFTLTWEQAEPYLTPAAKQLLAQ